MSDREQAITEMVDALEAEAVKIAGNAGRFTYAEDQRFHAARERLAQGLRATHGADAESIVSEAVTRLQRRLEPPTGCPTCGREVRRLSPYSPRANCVGCGILPAECRCPEQGHRRQDRRPTEGATP